MTKQFLEIPKGWQEKRFEDCILMSPKIRGLKSSEYKASGKYPIFDQAQEYISGFTDDGEVVTSKVPVILFGDHTRIFKYITKPYAVGADGTKIFYSKEGINSDFLYYSLLNLSIPNTGYNRHFKFLQETVIPIPPEREQKKIAEFLSLVDEEIQKNDRLIFQTEKLKKALTVSFFNAVPNRKRIGFAKLVHLRKIKINPKENGSEKYIGLENIEPATSTLLGYGISSDTTSIKTVFKKGDILFGKLRPYLRKYWKAEFDGVCTTEILVFHPKIKDDADFIFQIVQSDDFIAHSDSKSFGTKMPRTDWGIVSTFKVPTFSQKEKNEIATALSELDMKNMVTRKLKEKFTQLKKGLMLDLLSGKVRTIKY